MNGYFDIIICGGGLGGLTTAMLLADKGYSVAVFEKKRYPSHKVCGEYLSKELQPILDHIGVDPHALGAKDVERLHIQTSNGKQVSTSLTLGAWGISRYSLDHEFYQAALRKHVVVFQDEPVRHITAEGSSFIIRTEKGIYYSKEVIGAYGKRDLLDKSLHRDFLKDRSGYMAVKYHLKGNYPSSQIGLYPFENGFAGIVNVEGGRTCLCYLMKRDNMRGYKSVAEMEKNILYRHPVLEEALENSVALYEHPIVINEISFSFKEVFRDDIFYLGDSAAMIAPVCGNGMAMAVRGAVLLSEVINKKFKDASFHAAEYYNAEWKKQFAFRLQTGRAIQNVLMNSSMTSFLLPAMNLIPRLSSSLVRMTHGKTIQLNPAAGL
jgi:menaquinone-9 beta-reductase